MSKFFIHSTLLFSGGFLGYQLCQYGIKFWHLWDCCLPHLHRLDVCARVHVTRLDIFMASKSKSWSSVLWHYV